MRVLVAEKISEQGIDLLKEKFEVDCKYGLSADELVEIIKDYDALIVRSATRATREVIEAGTNLKVIGRAGVGIDNVDVVAATERGIIVCNAPTSNVVSAAEQTMALILACARKTPQANASMKDNKWERGDFTGVELFEKTLAIFGLGRIGSLVAERAKAFGMKIIAYDPYAAQARADQLGAELMDDPKEILARADFVTVHLPKTKETLGMFDRELLSHAKKGVILVNAARGGIYDEEAVLEGLQSGAIAGVGIDVFEQEPCTQSPLHDAPNAILTPHLGASTSEAQERAGTQIAEYVSLGLEGRMVATAVNVAPVPPDVMTVVRPFIDLSQDMGSIAAQLIVGGVERIKVTTVGTLANLDTRIITTAVLKGLLENVTDDPVNFVNANYLADQRDIKIEEVDRVEAYDYSALIILEVETSQSKVSIAGSVVGENNDPRIVSLLGYDVDMKPAEHMAVFTYPDRPGVIGRVGTVLGLAGINIGHMQVGRANEGGQALMILSVDSPLSAEVLTVLTCNADEPMDDAWYVQLGAKAPRVSKKTLCPLK